jgi:uncharacterized protein YegP (UPF0339 family)
MAYYIYRDNQNQWRWYFKAANGEKIAVSSEGYYNKADCLAGINLVKGSKDAPVYEV